MAEKMSSVAEFGGINEFCGYLGLGINEPEKISGIKNCFPWRKKFGLQSVLGSLYLEGINGE